MVCFPLRGTATPRISSRGPPFFVCVRDVVQSSRSHHARRVSCFSRLIHTTTTLGIKWSNKSVHDDDGKIRFEAPALTSSLAPTWIPFLPPPHSGFRPPYLSRQLARFLLIAQSSSSRAPRCKRNARSAAGAVLSIPNGSTFGGKLWGQFNHDDGDAQYELCSSSTKGSIATGCVRVCVSGKWLVYICFLSATAGGDHR